MWHALLVVALALIVVCWLTSFAVRRWAPRVATALGIAAGIVGRVAASGVFIGIAVQASERGSWWWLLTAVFGLLGLIGLSIVGLMTYALLSRSARDERDTAT